MVGEYSKSEWHEVVRAMAPDMSDDEYDYVWSEFVALKAARELNLGTVIAWPKAAGRMVDDRPRRLKRPCDAGLKLAVLGLETQLGTIEAYNRLVEAAEALRKKVERGEAQPQNSIYAVDIHGW